MVPDFVGSDYYCESGTNILPDCTSDSDFYPNDPLWDGENCNNAEATCCQDSSNQPWFNSTLPQIVNSSIELRVCTQSFDAETPLDIIELYIR